MRIFVQSDKNGKIVSVMEAAGDLVAMPETIGEFKVTEITDHSKEEMIRANLGHFNVINNGIVEKTSQEKKIFDDKQKEILSPSNKDLSLPDKRLDALVAYLIKSNLLPKSFDIKNLK